MRRRLGQLLLVTWALVACGGMEEPIKYAIESNSAVLTRHDDNTLTVSATLLDGDKAQADVRIIFFIRCDNDTVISLETTTDENGVATASTEEAVPEQNCSSTLTIDDGHNKPPLDVAEESAAPANQTSNSDDEDDEKETQPLKLMGTIHSITWSKNTNLIKCEPSTGVIVLNADNTTKMTIFRMNATVGSDIDLLVIPISGTKSINGTDDPSCKIGTTDIAFDSNAYNFTTTVKDFKKMDCGNRAAGICFTLTPPNGSKWAIGMATNGTKSKAKKDDLWIRMTETNNVKSYTVYKLLE